MHPHPSVNLGAEFGRKVACRFVRGNQQILQIALWKSHLTGGMEPDRGILYGTFYASSETTNVA